MPATRKMKAAVFSELGGPEVVRIDQVDVPEPGPGEARIAVRASSMNYLDLWVRRGLPIETTMPHIGGSDVAGTVDAVGPGAEHVPVGTRVVVDPSLGYEWYGGAAQGPSFPRAPFRILGEHTQGGFAEYALAPARNLLEIPANVDFETAAAAGLVTVTAWRGIVTRAAVKAGERVLITGASGGVATMAIQIARLAGARVYAVTSGPRNCERALELGADVVYDRLDVDFASAVWNDTNREGVDVVFDSVGHAVWRGCLKALRNGGRLVTYGATTGAKADTDIRLVFWKQLAILGTVMGDPHEFRTAMSLVFERVVSPVVDRVLPLEEAREAHELLEAGEVFGKLVLTP